MLIGTPASELRQELAGLKRAFLKLKKEGDLLKTNKGTFDVKNINFIVNVY